jgi:hypothetical protein
MNGAFSTLCDYPVLWTPQVLSLQERCVDLELQVQVVVWKVLIFWYFDATMLRNVKKCNFNEMMLSAANPASLLMIFGSKGGQGRSLNWGRELESSKQHHEVQTSRDTRSIIPLVRCIPPASMMTYDDNWPHHVPWIHTVNHCDPKCNLMTAWCLRFILLPKITYVDYFFYYILGSCGLHVCRGRGRPTERQVGFLGGPRSRLRSRQCGRHLRGSHLLHLLNRFCQWEIRRRITNEY